MNLKNLTSILKSGNVALGQKLQNLLTEDCHILEYTDDAILFQKDNFLVVAKFKHDLNESRMTSDSIIDNEVIAISLKDTTKTLKEHLVALVDNLVEDNYITAEDNLTAFCEQYFQFYVLKSKFPSLFTENLSKQAPGFKLRKKGHDNIIKFKSELFGLLSLKEGKEIEIREYTSILEDFGSVLFLGKPAVNAIVLDSVFGNVKLAEAITDKLFLVATTLSEGNEELAELGSEVDRGYDLEAGKFGDEDEDNVAAEDLDAPMDSIDDEFPVEETQENTEFTEFDPSTLSDEEVKELHKTILKSVLTSMADFVKREANNPQNSEMAADMDESLTGDLAALDGMEEVSDETLSHIEAKWQPIISYFLDSDLYTPDQDLGEEEIEVSAAEDEQGGEPIENEEPPVDEATPPMGDEAQAATPVPGSTEPMAMTPEEEEQQKLAGIS